jgi:uncharacterized membrane protein YfcA
MEISRKVRKVTSAPLLSILTLLHGEADTVRSGAMESAVVIQWIILLFVFTFLIGIISPISGVGGGVLFVPLATAFFPFSVDFIRGAGLIMALTSSLSSSPYLIKKGLASVRVMVPVAVVSNIASILGGMAGLWMTNAFPTGQSLFTVALGFILLFIFLIMVLSRRVEYPEIQRSDNLSERLNLAGSWFEPTLDKVIGYRVTNLAYGMAAFAGVGFVAGMFGLGAGWASVPVLNLVMGVPIKVATATSMAIITINSAAASWVYLAGGAVLPLICVPSVVGISIGARLGAKLAARIQPLVVKYLVMGIMIFAAVTNIFKGLRGLGVW